jgi:seryl-tRNA synthetase
LPLQDFNFFDGKSSDKDGSIKIPKVLQPYMGGKKIIEIKQKE